jgi:CRISPR/Cas system CSM-associated protein Csm4 (group 5 of RAMP superfamily)
MSGLSKIGGILGLVRIVSFLLFYLHRYLFEKHINKELSLKEEGEDDMEKDPKQLKVRYSIETYE